jgi:hypothetical protein
MATLHYFPCIPVFAELIKQQQILFDDSLPFQRSTFRNRTIIAGSNGMIQLSIPIIGGRSVKLPYRYIEIDYKNDWQRDHFRTLCTVYGNSPFYMFYKDELEALFESQPTFLFEWNLQCLQWVFRKIKLDTPIFFEKEFNEKDSSIFVVDRFLPSNYSDENFSPFLKYSQVFEDKIGFKPNLSILDLLFNVGPQTKSLLLG